MIATALCLLGCAQSVQVGGTSSDAATGSAGSSISSSSSSAISSGSGTTPSGTTTSGTTPSGTTTSGTTTPSSTTTALPLAIEGSPPTAVVAGTSYAFHPSVSQATGTVTFTIANEPAWASFDPATGALGGTPSIADVGTTANITIAANDAAGTATIGPFDITVTAPMGSPSPNPPGTATLSWVAPTSNMDGSPLIDLAGYHIYYGTSATSLSEEVVLSSASATTYVINNLTSGTYYFAVTAVSSEGTESVRSNVASKTI